jgi:hypothetical protein
MLILVILFEIIKGLQKTHKTGDIPLDVAFPMLTVLLMIVLDVIWHVARPNATGVDRTT